MDAAVASLESCPKQSAARPCRWWRANKDKADASHEASSFFAFSHWRFIALLVIPAASSGEAPQWQF
jgi:hypothetical protein